MPDPDPKRQWRAKAYLPKATQPFGQIKAFPAAFSLWPLIIEGSAILVAVAYLISRLDLASGLNLVESRSKKGESSSEWLNGTLAAALVGWGCSGIFSRGIARVTRGKDWKERTGMLIDLPEELGTEIEALAVKNGISASELLVSWIESDFDELQDCADALSRIRKPETPISISELRSRLASNGVEH
jgi:hypothetical protein